MSDVVKSAWFKRALSLALAAGVYVVVSKLPKDQAAALAALAAAAFPSIFQSAGQKDEPAQ